MGVVVVVYVLTPGVAAIYVFTPGVARECPFTAHVRAYKRQGLYVFIS